LGDVTFDEWGQLGLALEAMKKKTEDMIRVANQFRRTRIRSQTLAGDDTGPVITLPESQALVIPPSEPPEHLKAP
jgi:hypothetical protein